MRASRADAEDSAAGRKFAARPTECPVSADVSGRLMRLPFHNGLSVEETDRVGDALVRSLERVDAR